MRGTHDSTQRARKVSSSPPQYGTKGQARPRHYLTVAELCEELVISPRTAYQLLARGEIPHMRIGRSIRVYRDTLEEWRREQEGAISKESDQAAVSERGGELESKKPEGKRKE